MQVRKKDISRECHAEATLLTALPRLPSITNLGHAGRRAPQEGALRGRDVVVAVVSALGGAVALAWALSGEEPSTVGLALAGLLLLNALVRAELARRG